MAYGKNGKFINITGSQRPLERKMEERLANSREEKPSRPANIKTSQNSGNSDQLSAYSLFSKFRLLPAVALLAFILMAIRVPNFFDLSDKGSDASIMSNLAEAQEQSQTVTSKNKASPGGKKVSKEKKAKAKEKEKLLDPVLFTRSEIELLQELSRRRKELDAREQTIVQREGLLMAAENRLEARINELETVKSDIETLITQYDAQEEEKFRGLVAIYEKMKPKESARIFDELDINILLEVFERMKASKSASILAKMRPDRAKEITSRIADRREMPKLN